MDNCDPVPQSTTEWIQLGYASFQQKQYTEALAAFDRAIAEDAQNPKAWNYRGNVLCALDRPAEALAAYDRAVALKSDYPEAWFNRGLLFTDMGAYGNAISSYDAAIALDPDPCYLHAKADIWLKKKLIAV
jgi:tetratricopeptide (TPR) repeat protein